MQFEFMTTTAASEKAFRVVSHGHVADITGNSGAFTVEFGCSDGWSENAHDHEAIRILPSSFHRIGVAVGRIVRESQMFNETIRNRRVAALQRGFSDADIRLRFLKIRRCRLRSHLQRFQPISLFLKLLCPGTKFDFPGPCTTRLLQHV